MLLVAGARDGNDGTPYLNEEDRAKLWKAHMSKTMID